MKNRAVVILAALAILLMASVAQVKGESAGTWGKDEKGKEIVVFPYDAPVPGHFLLVAFDKEVMEHFEYNDKIKVSYSAYKLNHVKIHFDIAKAHQRGKDMQGVIYADIKAIQQGSRRSVMLTGVPADWSVVGEYVVAMFPVNAGWSVSQVRVHWAAAGLEDDEIFPAY